MSVYQYELPSFPLLSKWQKITYDSLESPGLYRRQAHRLCKSCLDGIVAATNRKQPLMISDRARLPSLPPCKETVCLITTRIEGVKTSWTNHCSVKVPPPVGPASECDPMQVYLHR